MTGTGTDMTERDRQVARDEIRLADILGVLWHRRVFIALVTLLSSLAVLMVTVVSPTTYTTTYTYEMKLLEGSCRVMTERFFAAENIAKLTEQLQAATDGDYDEDIEDVVTFGAFPPYVEHDQPGRLRPEDLEELRALTSELVTLTVMGTDEERLARVSSIIRRNFEHIVPVYAMQADLVGSMASNQRQMAEIEQSRIDLAMDLERLKATLAKLDQQPIRSAGEGIVLQFTDVGETESLPLSLQRQTVASRVINLEENRRYKDARHAHLTQLLAVQERLLRTLDEAIAAGTEAQDFRDHVAGLVDEYEEEDLKDYLHSYARFIDVRLAGHRPAVADPHVWPVPWTGYRLAAIVFGAMLLLSVIVVFMWEGVRRGQAAA